MLSLLPLLSCVTFFVYRCSAASLVRSARSDASEILSGNSLLAVAGARGQILHADEPANRTMKAVYPWYHTTKDLQNQAKALVGKCNNMMTFKTMKDHGVSIDLIEVRKRDTEPLNRVFILFGEHARELVSPESGLHFLKVLCGTVKPVAGAPSAESVLQDSSFQVVLNANPRSRLKVEDGDFCLRTNPDGVDLNRNWDEQWRGDATGITNPGPKPFSEPETRIFKQLVTAFKPTTFLTVHSGTRGLYMPWAYDMKHLANRNEPMMMQVLRELDAKHCQCPFGAAGKEVGYSCPGTCLDWVYDKLKTPYSFAFEIYTSSDNDADLKQRWEEKLKSGGLKLMQTGENLGHSHFRSLFQEHHSDFVHHSVHKHKQLTEQEPDNCFGTFNPPTKEAYVANMNNWAATYLELAAKIAGRMKNASSY